MVDRNPGRLNIDEVEKYLEDKNPRAADLFRQFRELALACWDDVETSVSKTVVFFKRKRVFAGAHVRGKRLEPVIDLLREAQHPCLRGAFHNTKKVITHRLTITKAEELDASVSEMLREAYDTVGPGTR